MPISWSNYYNRISEAKNPEVYTGTKDYTELYENKAQYAAYAFLKDLSASKGSPGVLEVNELTSIGFSEDAAKYFLSKSKNGGVLSDDFKSEPLVKELRWLDGYGTFNTADNQKVLFSRLDKYGDLATKELQKSKKKKNNNQPSGIYVPTAHHKNVMTFFNEDNADVVATDLNYGFNNKDKQPVSSKVAATKLAAMLANGDDIQETVKNGVLLDKDTEVAQAAWKELGFNDKAIKIITGNKDLNQQKTTDELMWLDAADGNGDGMILATVKARLNSNDRPLRGYYLSDASKEKQLAPTNDRAEAEKRFDGFLNKVAGQTVEDDAELSPKFIKFLLGGENLGDQATEVEKRFRHAFGTKQADGTVTITKKQARKAILDWAEKHPLDEDAPYDGVITVKMLQTLPKVSGDNKGDSGNKGVPKAGTDSDNKKTGDGNTPNKPGQTNKNNDPNNIYTDKDPGGKTVIEKKVHNKNKSQHQQSNKMTLGQAFKKALLPGLLLSTVILLISGGYKKRPMHYPLPTTYPILPWGNTATWAGGLQSWGGVNMSNTFFS